MLNRWIQAREGFFGELRRLALPIIFQNLIAAAVTMADVVMLGRVTQTALSASSLAGQVHPYDPRVPILGEKGPHDDR